jgi:hypothetical protein
MNEKPDDLMASPRSWPDDYPGENGQYMCECFSCKQRFVGHKRRVICRECAFPKESDTSRTPYR